MRHLAIILCLLLPGCSSATKAIGTAAREVSALATGIGSDLAAAKATGDVGPLAEPYLDEAGAKADAILGHATAIADALPGVQDKEGWFAKLLRTAWWIVVIVGLCVLSVIYAPIILPVLKWLGAVVNWIPRPIKIDAASDAELIADSKGGKAITETQTRAIEAKKADPRYRKALDKELVARGIPT